MRTQTTMRRFVTGISVAAVLASGLLVAEHRTVPAAIKTQSIAAHKFSLPALPTSPKLTAISPTLTGLKTKGPSAAALPTGTATPSSFNGGGFFFPITGPTCLALFIERAALQAGPQGPATDDALRDNAAALAFFGCIPVSGQPFNI